MKSKNTNLDIKPAGEYCITTNEVRVTIRFADKENPDIKVLIRSLLGTAYKEKLKLSA